MSVTAKKTLKNVTETMFPGISAQMTGAKRASLKGSAAMEHRLGNEIVSDLALQVKSRDSTIEQKNIRHLQKNSGDSEQGLIT